MKLKSNGSAPLTSGDGNGPGKNFCMACGARAGLLSMDGICGKEKRLSGGMRGGALFAIELCCCIDFDVVTVGAAGVRSYF